MNKRTLLSSALWLSVVCLLAQCGGASDDSGPPVTCATTAALTNTESVTVPSGTNVLPISINGTGCNNYPNEPCVSVTICQPGTGTCQTINNILLDTGSFGLRIFKSLLTGVSLTGITSGSGTLAECVQYADLSSEWGSVAMADVVLGQSGGLKASNVPIHLIEYNYSGPPSQCSSTGSIPDQSPAQAGFNGILGMGVFQYDCGAECVTNSNNFQYYACSGSTCLRTTVGLGNQVQNPAPLFPAPDNNGLIITLPSIPDSGAASALGYLTFGIGSRANNTPTATVTLETDGFGEFNTLFPYSTSDTSYGFLDTGSTFYAFPQFSTTRVPFGSGTAAGLNLSQLYCPSETLALSAANWSALGSNGNACVGVKVGNAQSLLSNGNAVYANVAAYIGTISGFDFGLPFFFGRNVAVGFELKTSTLGTGPLVAY